MSLLLQKNDGAIGQSVLSISTLRAEKHTMAVDAFKKSVESYSSKIYPLCLMIPWYPRKIMQCRGHCPSILVNLETCCTDLYIANPRRKCLQRFVFVATKLFVHYKKKLQPFGVHQKDWEESSGNFPCKQTWQKTVARFGVFISLKNAFYFISLLQTFKIRLGNFAAEPHISSRFPL